MTTENIPLFLNFTESNVNESSNVSSQDTGQSQEEYIGKMMNIVARPILIIFGTLGKCMHSMYID